ARAPSAAAVGGRARLPKLGAAAAQVHRFPPRGHRRDPRHPPRRPRAREHGGRARPSSRRGDAPAHHRRGRSALMAEWLSYTLADFALFSPTTYRRMLELYNVAIWPAQPFALALGGLVPLLAARPGATGRIAAVLLALAWSWSGWLFHLGHYAAINWAASGFAAAFLLQAALLLAFGAAGDALAAAPTPTARSRAGLGLFLFALLAYPFVGLPGGGGWREAEILGLFPDPTALATLGLLLMARRAPLRLLAVPLVWCAIAGATLWQLDPARAWLLPAAAIAVLAMRPWRDGARQPEREGR